MALDPKPERLPCGVELDALVAQVADDAPGPDAEHEATCPYCQTALRGLGAAWGDFQSLARAPVPIPRGLTARIMHRVRDLAHRAAQNVILASTRGHTQISHTVIAQVARRAALAVPGVLFASAQPTPGQAKDPDHLTLSVRLVTTYGPTLHAIADAVRTTLRRRLATLTGAEVERIDITIIDIDIDTPSPPPPPARREGRPR